MRKIGFKTILNDSPFAYFVDAIIMPKICFVRILQSIDSIFVGIAIKYDIINGYLAFITVCYQEEMLNRKHMTI